MIVGPGSEHDFGQRDDPGQVSRAEVIVVQSDAEECPRGPPCGRVVAASVNERSDQYPGPVGGLVVETAEQVGDRLVFCELGPPLAPHLAVQDLPDHRVASSDSASEFRPRAGIGSLRPVPAVALVFSRNHVLVVRLG